MKIPLRAPAGGGDQISVRLPDDVLEGLSEQAERLGWNRNQVVLFLLDEGLAELRSSKAPEVV